MSDEKLDGLYAKALKATKKKPTRKALGYYVTEAAPDGETYLYTRDQDAFQILVGWGSDQNKIDGSFYGNLCSTAPRTKGGGLSNGWRWKFNSDNSRAMVKIINAYIDDKNYYNPAEKIRAKELRSILEQLR